MIRDLQKVSEKLEGTAENHGKLKLWLRLLTCTIKVENLISNRLRAQFNTTLPRFDVMAALARSEGDLTMGELSKWLLVSNGNVTGVVSRLVKDGLVERRRAKDRRVQYVRLTAAGRRQFKTIAAAHEGWINQMLDPLSDRDVRSLMQQLSKLKGVH
ncbi:MAG: MarR family transcriptional regulator [Proteobacteria bacterium]|nr:MarR family transcriptional regulator [Pseudomonadota bacterium]